MIQLNKVIRLKNEIILKVKDKNILFHPLNDEFLSESLDQYLIKSCILINQKEVVLRIRGKFSKTDEGKIKNTIHSFYENKTIYCIKKDKMDDTKRFFLLLLGIILILMSYVFSFVLREIFLVAGWVAIWEMFSDLLFKENERKKEISLYRKLAESKIVFDNKDK